MSGIDGINSLHSLLGGLQVNEAKNVGGTAAAKGGSPSNAAAQVTDRTVDSASLSAAGGLAASSATDLSDVRTTRVAELRQAIANGTYNVPASAVANKIVEGLLG